MGKILMANDHGAVELKNRLKKWLEDKGYSVEDLGVNSQDSVDYPDMAEMACNKYKQGGYNFGILLCGTGIGISIAANKVEGIRCALPQNSFAAQMAREHNNANFLAFGGRIDYPETPEEMVDAFINGEFGGDRHQRRIDKMMNIEKKTDE